MNEKMLSTMKSLEVEGWLDIHVLRPAAFQFVRIFAKLGIHPNVVSILSMLIGAGSAFFFVHGSYYYEGTTGLIYNLVAILLLMTAYLFDDVDGQLARYTHKCTRLGRMLDGVASAFWYIPIYLLMIVRIYRFHDIEFGWFGIEDTQTNVIIATVIAGILIHIAGYFGNMAQERTADYYNQIHLFFLKGEKGSELDSSVKLKEELDSMPKDGYFFDRLSQASYINYTKLQERRTPQFQKLMAKLHEMYGATENIPQEFRTSFHDASLPLMRYNNMLTFCFRTFLLAVFSLADIPFFYFFVEATLMSLLKLYVIRRHEKMCSQMYDYLVNSETK